MSKFERVSKYPKAVLPTRGTRYSAGYDLSAAKDTLVPSLVRARDKEKSCSQSFFLSQIKERLKNTPVLKPVLVTTGVKIKLDPDCFLSISARSSLPLNSLLIVANAPGIIDADYYNNPKNEGEIFIQLINLSPFDIVIREGDRIAQGVIHKYLKTEDDSVETERIGGSGSTGVR